MNVETFCEHFATFADAPNGVVKLREMILQLAIQGKLIPQDPNDISALPLAKNQKKLVAEITTKELPFGLPDSWRWCRLGSIAEFINGDRGKNYPNKEEYVPIGLPFINTGHIEPDGRLDSHSMHYITREKFDSLSSPW